MDIQIVLNWVIQVVVMGFVSLIIIDFVNTVFDACTRAIIAAQIQQLDPSLMSKLIATTKPEPVAASEFVLTDNPKQEPQFEELPDPWFTTDFPATPILPQAVVLPFPTLRLLSAAVEVQPKARATKKSTPKPKSTTAKKTSKPTNKATTQNRSKSRKSAA
ncbi:hypothetical protein LC593_33600 [Nostoc sp. CHAB 5844]|nr:hypothetical protein [Nostoc sp. CHAB 5844]